MLDKIKANFPSWGLGDVARIHITSDGTIIINKDKNLENITDVLKVLYLIVKDFELYRDNQEEPWAQLILEREDDDEDREDYSKGV